jgi:RimJ/RimL family protein N-acetyltransferase
MRLQRYAIELDSLRSEHLEMVRLWRNQDYIRSNMLFQELLSREDQEKWFAGLDKGRNLYWVIRTHGYPIGLIHIKDIDLERSVGEAGIFIGEPSYLEMPQPMLAILFMMEVAFFAIDLSRLKAKIKSGNRHAISFNQKLGYQLIPDQPEGFQYYEVAEEDFISATERLRLQSAHMYGNQTMVAQVSPLSSLGSDLIKGISRADNYFNPKFV